VASPEGSVPPSVERTTGGGTTSPVHPLARRERDPSGAESDLGTLTESPVRAVHVTIGRIEVRAVTPPASPEPKAASSRPSRALSLEDYLKQRVERR
jgi:hypothetical protein